MYNNDLQYGIVHLNKYCLHVLIFCSLFLLWNVNDDRQNDSPSHHSLVLYEKGDAIKVNAETVIIPNITFCVPQA